MRRVPYPDSRAWDPGTDITMRQSLCCRGKTPNILNIKQLVQGPAHTGLLNITAGQIRLVHSVSDTSEDGTFFQI